MAAVPCVAFVIFIRAGRAEGPVNASPRRGLDAPPLAEPGFAFGAPGVFAESPDRIFVAQQAVRLPDHSAGLYGFAGSIGMNVLTLDRRVWKNCPYTLDRNGKVKALTQWDHREAESGLCPIAFASARTIAIAACG